MCVYYVESMCDGRIRLGWAHDVFTFACYMFMHFSCIYTNFFSFLLILTAFGTFLRVFLSFSLSFFRLVAVWHLNVSPLRPRTLFIPRHPLLLLPLLILHPLTFDSTMRRPIQTSWNAKSFYRTFSILTFPLSSTIGVGSHCLASWSLFPSWTYRSFTWICTDLTILYIC